MRLPRHSLLLVTLAVLPLSGCAIFSSIFPQPEFSVSGATVVCMPFKGPGDAWYGENRETTYLFQKFRSLLREGGATLRPGDNLLRNYEKDDTPPWVTYGQRLKADYVIVGHLLTWDIAMKKAVGYCPGRAALQVEIHDVQRQDLTFDKIIDVSVGTDYTSMEIYTDPVRTKRALTTELIKGWKKVFLGE